MLYYFDYHNIRFVGEELKEDDFTEYSEEEVISLLKDKRILIAKDKKAFLIDPPSISKEDLRNKRKYLFQAFDKWEKAVLRGREEDSEEIMNWYYSLLALNEEDFKDENIPERIKYYMR